MDLGVLTGVAVLCATAPIALVVLYSAWRNRSLPGVRAFLLIVVLAFWWALGYAVELFVPDLDDKLVWSNLQFVSITLLPAAMLWMALDYTGRRAWTRPLRLAVLCLLPVITNILLWTDGHLHLLRGSAWLETSGSYPVIGRSWGPWFWVHGIYSYLLLAIAVLLLAAAFFSRPTLHRNRLLAILMGTLAPVGASITETLLPSSSPLDDLSPAFFILGVLLLGWGLLRVRIFNLVPIARHALVENMRDGVLVLDVSGRVVDLNESACKIIGQPKRKVLSRPLAECWEAWEQMAVPHSAGAEQAEMRLTVDGTDRHYEARSSPLRQRGQVEANLLVLTDITDRVLLEKSLRDQALTDSLTGLPNRALFMVRLDDTIRQAKRHKNDLFAVMILDLDDFKSINDSLGHLAGDVLLQNVAAKLQRCVREADTVARLGGDEFIILLHEISSQRDLLPILTRIRDELRTPVYFKQQAMVTACSVGVAIWDSSYSGAEALVRAADTAMYQAKEDGKDRYRLFDEEMHRAVVRSLEDEMELRAAVKDHSFSMTYQPVVDLRSGHIHSLEALLRWHHPERGTVFPRDFLSVAESSGLIVSLGEIAFDEVFSQMEHWQAQGNQAGSLPVRVNISPGQLVEPDFISSVLSRLAAWQISSERLVLEVTENALVRDPARARQAMKRLRGLGVRLCLDDFGTGRSSLQHLVTFPVQELKVDPVYVAGALPGNRDLEIIRHIAALAHTLGLQVTAEGIERAEQWEHLADVGCDLAQGYYVASPMEPDVLIEFLGDLQHDGEALCLVAPRVRSRPTMTKNEDPAARSTEGVV